MGVEKLMLNLPILHTFVAVFVTIILVVVLQYAVVFAGAVIYTIAETFYSQISLKIVGEKILQLAWVAGISYISSFLSIYFSLKILPLATRKTVMIVAVTLWFLVALYLVKSSVELNHTSFVIAKHLFIGAFGILGAVSGKVDLETAKIIK